MSQRWCPHHLGANYYQATGRGLFGEETWSLCDRILPPQEVSYTCCELSLRLVGIEGGKYTVKTGGLSRDSLGRGIPISSVFPPTPDQAHQEERTLKARGETILDNIVFWIHGFNRQVRTR